MAPNFYDGRHGLPLNTIIYFEINSRQSNKMIRQIWYVHIECKFKVVDTNKFCLVDFNMVTIFQDGRHRLYWITTLCLKVAADSQKMIWE